jgi:(S)-mandelate dehydrogenase
VFGREQPLPIIIAPTGNNGLMRRHGDSKLARAAARAGIPFTLSTVSNTRPETIRAEAPDVRLWMQLYVLGGPEVTESVITHAEAAEAEALVFTTDANVFGNREWDRRNFRAPGKPTWPRMIDAALHLPWFIDVFLPNGLPEFVNVADFLPPNMRSALNSVSRLPALFRANLDWDQVARLRDRWRGTLIIKGVLHPEDVEKAIALGVNGVVLTNHGGRQLDGSITPFEMLPELTKYRDRITLIVDSGFRRGSEVAKALALGAHAVMIGRATLYGLAAGGEAGASHAIDILRTELDRVLGQIGCRSIAELSPELLRKGWPTARTPRRELADRDR